MRAPALVALLTFSAGLVACVLFVPGRDDTAGATCGLTSDERGTSCGTCVEKSCRAVLDACCAAGKGCESSIPAVVLCKSDESSCAAAGTSEAELSLRACVKSACADDCGDGLPKEKDAAPEANLVCGTRQDACSCTAQNDAGAEGSRCDTSSSGVSKQCCADDGYPGLGKSCGCFPVQCIASANECTCTMRFATDSSARTTCPSSSFRTCCASATSCKCFYTSGATCESDAREVSSCSASDVGCFPDTKKVTFCSK